MTKDDGIPTRVQWARLRFQIIGPFLASPPEAGELGAKLDELATKNYVRKSVALRVLTQRLRALRDVVVGTIDHPRSGVSDFYREIGDVFGVPFPNHNRWAGCRLSDLGQTQSTATERPARAVLAASSMASREKRVGPYGT